MIKFILIMFLASLFSQSKFDPYTGEIIEDKNYNKSNSISVDFLTNKSMNMIQYTKDVKLSDYIALFGIIGFFNHYGLGISWQEDYNKDGYLAGLSFIKNNDYDFMSFAVSRQWLFGNYTNFLSLGLMAFYRFPNEKKIDNKHAWLGIAPIISIDLRF
mgnify:CR=1 FL=1